MGTYRDGSDFVALRYHYNCVCKISAAGSRTNDSKIEMMLGSKAPFDPSIIKMRKLKIINDSNYVTIVLKLIKIGILGRRIYGKGAKNYWRLCITAS